MDGPAALVVLLPSPLLGPATWRPVAGLLRAAGRPVHVVALPEVATPQDVVDAVLAQLPDDRPLLLVPHSSSGLYVAAICAVRDVRGAVFVDAGLPSGDATTPAAPPSLLDHLRPLADGDGRLPGWTGWWPPEDLAALFPDAATRAAVEQEQRRLPLSYFGASIPSPPGWQAVPCAYLGFGDTYAEEQLRARERGWPVVVIPGRHLHQLVSPAQVGDDVDRLLASLSVSGRRPAARPPTR